MSLDLRVYKICAHLCVILCVALMPLIADAQDAGYVYRAPAIQQKQDSSLSPECLPRKTLDELVGQQLIFQPQKNGLQDFYPFVTLTRSGDLDKVVDIPYRQLVGKSATVLQVLPPDQLLGRPQMLVRLDESGKQLVMGTTNSAFDEKPELANVSLLSDITALRKKWIGKTLWYSFAIRYTESESGHLHEGKRYQPVEVTDVTAGTGLFDDTDFVLKDKNSGEVFVASTDLEPFSCSLWWSHQRKTYYTEDPRLTHQWSDGVWAALVADRIDVGMTEEQVEFLRGAPNKINESRTAGSVTYQWIYSSEFVYTDGLKVTGVQVVE